MANSYTITTQKTWAQTRDDIAECIAQWSRYASTAIHWSLDCLAPPSQAKSATLPTDQRAVTVTFTHPRTGRRVQIRADDQRRPVDNARKAYLILEDLRMIERRGFAEQMASAWLQIEGPAGARARDPYEVLGVRADSPPEVIEGAYRALAKRHHPDAGGDADTFKAIQGAYQQIKGGE